MREDIVHKALVLFGIDASTPYTIHRESADNVVFIIGITAKKILRISKRLRREDIMFECEAVKHLMYSGISVPQFTPAKSGKCYISLGESVAVLSDFIEGRHVGVEGSDPPNEAQAYQAGKCLAHIHNAGAGFVPSTPRLRNIFSELERALSLKESFVHRIEGGAILIDQIEAAIEFGKDYHGPVCFLHNDYRPSNVFFDRTDRIISVIDFDWSCMGPTVKDVALGVLEWSFPDRASKPNLAIFERFLEGYNSVAIHRATRDRKLYDWISFAAISDAATYFCDLIENTPEAGGIIKRVDASYMYNKYKFFKELET